MDIKRFDEKGHMIVGENYCCEHWEPDDEALVPMKECWCCKWSSFETEDGGPIGQGACGYVGNSRDAILQDDKKVIG